MDGKFEELEKNIDANTKMIEALMSGLLDEKIIYNDDGSFETINLEIRLTSFDIESKICFLTGGEYNPKTGKCKHKK